MKILFALFVALSLGTSYAQASCKDCGCKKKCSVNCACPQKKADG
jgi:hypothetical protein